MVRATSDDRTPEQRAADESLTQAIDAIVAAYYPDIQLTILGDYLVCGALSGLEGDSLVFSHPKDGDFPFYRQMGLIDYIHARHKAIVGEEDEE